MRHLGFFLKLILYCNSQHRSHLLRQQLWMLYTATSTIHYFFWVLRKSNDAAIICEFSWLAWKRVLWRSRMKQFSYFVTQCVFYHTSSNCCNKSNKLSTQNCFSNPPQFILRVILVALTLQRKYLNVYIKSQTSPSPTKPDFLNSYNFKNF